MNAITATPALWLAQCGECGGAKWLPSEHACELWINCHTHDQSTS